MYKYSGINVILSGDMRQLEAFQGEPLYSYYIREFHEFVNCYIELDALHRFKDDIEFGLLLRRWRNGELTVDDLELLNRECLLWPGTVLPEGIQYATYYNRDRAAINTGLLEQHCETAPRDETGCVADAILVLADDVAIKNGQGKYVHFGGSLTFWQSCGEADCDLGKGNGRMDPVLKLYRGCPVMLTQNHDVPRGKANGTRALVKQVLLKSEQSPTIVTLSPGVKVWAARAGQVDKILLHHLNDRVQPAIFDMQPKQFSFRASLPTPAVLSTSEYA